MGAWWFPTGAPPLRGGGAARAAGVGWGTRAGRTRGGEGLPQTLQTTQLPRQDARDMGAKGFVGCLYAA